MVLANLLSLSEINPFAAPETASYKTDPQIVAMTDLVSAYENHDIHSFERILQNNRDTIMDDKFISMYIQDLLKNIRTQVLTNILRPYTRVTISFISKVSPFPSLPPPLSLLVFLFCFSFTALPILYLVSSLIFFLP